MEWQSTATTQKIGDSSLRPPLFSCVPPPLRTTPPKPNQCLSVHLSTWSAQMDQEIERRLKGEYREKQKGVSKKKRGGRKRGSSLVRDLNRGAVWLTQPALNSCREREAESEMHKKRQRRREWAGFRSPGPPQTPHCGPTPQVAARIQRSSFGSWTWRGALGGIRSHL